MWRSGSIAVAVGACLGSGALVYATRQSGGTNRSLGQARPTPRAMVERPCGAGMALAGVLGEPGVL